ncbi:hypothetical protein BJ742DRAFT_821551 [Cladochytrium replicatum]|nr:hypothetical protein BJ742DRAFT_821551 [Cladochytrium replicatum]
MAKTWTGSMAGRGIVLDALACTSPTCTPGTNDCYAPTCPKRIRLAVYSHLPGDCGLLLPMMACMSPLCQANLPGGCYSPTCVKTIHKQLSQLARSSPQLSRTSPQLTNGSLAAKPTTSTYATSRVDSSETLVALEDIIVATKDIDGGYQTPSMEKIGLVEPVIMLQDSTNIPEKFNVELDDNHTFRQESPIPPSVESLTISEKTSSDPALKEDMPKEVLGNGHSNSRDDEETATSRASSALDNYDKRGTVGSVALQAESTGDHRVSAVMEDDIEGATGRRMSVADVFGQNDTLKRLSIKIQDRRISYRGSKDKILPTSFTALEKKDDRLSLPADHQPLPIPEMSGRRPSMVEGIAMAAAAAVTAAANAAAKSMGIVMESDEEDGKSKPKRALPDSPADYMAQNPFTSGPDTSHAVAYWTSLLALYGDQGDFPECAEAHYQLGMIYERSRNYQSPELATKHFTEAARRGHTEGQFRAALALETRLNRNYALASEFLTLAAESGHALAMHRLADHYLNGDSPMIPQDPSQAVSYLRKASEKGHVDASYKLGLMYNYGNGVAVDKKEAVRLFRQAAFENHPRAQYELGKLHVVGAEGLARSPPTAVKYLEKAASQGLSDAEFELGRILLWGEDYPRDPLVGIKMLGRASVKGHTGARVALAEWHLDSAASADARKKQADIDEAIRLLRLSSEDGNGKALTMLGKAYLNGQGVPKYPLIAVKYFERAAAANHKEGQFMLGECYRLGDGVPKDPITALKLYQKAGEGPNAHPGAVLQLGNHHAKGIGVPSDPSKAVQYYKKAETENMASATYNLGICHRDGVGVRRELTVALEYFERAARQGHLGASYEAGRCYLLGEGCTTNLTKAAEYFRQAAENAQHPDAAYEYGMILLKQNTALKSRAVEFIKMSAELGHLNAQYEYGRALERGEGIPQDVVAASHWYRQASDQGHAEATYSLGNLLENGDGTEKNPKEAMKCYESAANFGVATAQVRLAEIFEMGALGVKKDPDVALAYWHQAANRSHPYAQAVLGHLYFSGTGGVPRDVHVAFSYLTLAAAADIAEAQYELGVLYETGEGTQQDVKAAIELYKKSANRSHPDAQRALGLCYERGEGGLSKDNYRAFELISAAARQGLPTALVNLARYYEEGIGCQVNLFEALSLYQQAADMGDPIAQFNLACMYERGEPAGYLHIDLPKALKLYESAAAQGLAVAQYNVAVLLETGAANVHDERKAIDWYTLAAEEGIVPAQVHLARRYELGDGVPKDLERAVILYHKAAARGDRHSQCVLGTFYKAGKVVQRDAVAAAEFFQLASEGEDGLPEAKYRLAILYEQGDGVAHDFAKALDLYRQAMEGGHVGAKLALAKLYHRGLGSKLRESEISLALELYRSAAVDDNSAAAAYCLARALEHGDLEIARGNGVAAGDGEDEPSALLSIQVDQHPVRTSSVSTPEATPAISTRSLYTFLTVSSPLRTIAASSPFSSPPQPTRSSSVTEPASTPTSESTTVEGSTTSSPAQGQAEEQYEPASQISRHWWTLKTGMDKREILDFYRMASIGGEKRAKYRMGLLVLFGNGSAPPVATAASEALALLVESAEEGYTDSCVLLGWCYEVGVKARPIRDEEDEDDYGYGDDNDEEEEETPKRRVVGEEELVEIFARDPSKAVEWYRIAGHASSFARRKAGTLGSAMNLGQVQPLAVLQGGFNMLRRQVNSWWS